MNRTILFSFVMLLSVASMCQANPTAWFGTAAYTPLTTTYTFTTGGGSLDAQLFVANDPSTNSLAYVSQGGIMGLDLYIQLGPGGFSQTGADPGPKFNTGTPVITAPNGQLGNSGYVIHGGDPISATLFEMNHSPVGDGGNSTDQLSQMSLSVNGSPVIPPDLPSSVLLATLHITIPPGPALGSNWPIVIDGSASPLAAPLDFADSGDFNRDQNGHVFGLFNATILIVPEPSAVILGLLATAGLAAVAIRKRRTRRIDERAI